MKMCVGRPALQKFYDDLLAEALSIAVSGRPPNRSFRISF